MKLDTLQRRAEKRWSIAGRTVSFAAGPLVMGILNVTPDSFSDGGTSNDLGSAISKAEIMISEGADILDIGGESTRPGGERVDAQTEMNRVIPVIEAVRKVSEVPISIDTSRSAVAREAIVAGASIINDISGLRFDPAMAEAVAETDAGLVLMHLKGDFATMHSKDPDSDIVQEVKEGLASSIEKAVEAGIGKKRLCIDVGIGFGKTFEQNLELLRSLDKVARAFEDIPMLIGVSRKSFIGQITGEPVAAKRLAGSIAANCAAVYRGADIVRVHDVKASVEAVGVINAIGGTI